MIKDDEMDFSLFDGFEMEEPDYEVERFESDEEEDCEGGACKI